MKHSSIPSAQLVVQHCKAKKLQNIVISPGSRNAPLIIGFTEDPYFTCYSIVDERSAAFFALGIAQQLKEPVALVCTSGSALLNYYPAIAEAFYSGIPIVAITADRPVYKIDVGDGQTIRQDHVFDRHIGYSANLRQDVTHSLARVQKYASQWLKEGTAEENQSEIKQFNDSELNKALNVAVQVKLPVHINVPFEEPLYDTVDQPTEVALTVMPQNSSEEVEIEMEPFVKTWKNSERKMVLVGVNAPNEIDVDILEALANDPTVIVFTETTSNLHHKNFFASIDSIVAPIEKASNTEELFNRLKPDILLTFGGLVVSKKIKAFLREYSPDQHWHLDQIKAFNTFFSLTEHVKQKPNDFLRKLLFNGQKAESDYYSYWSGRKKNYEVKRDEYLAQIEFSDLLAFESILKFIPKETQVHLSNSSTVRYAQLFNLDNSLHVYCNRGTSGIDGSTSTAVGASINYTGPTLLITGDLSFFYDSNAMWNSYIRPDFRIILINNSGGGIFRILPGRDDSENFETFFETKHQMSGKLLSEQFGFNHQIVDEKKGLENALKEFFLPSQFPKVLEVSTPRLLNNKILLGYFDFIS
ncbi:MAG: 2-succinyl-5-enolpyruvyl-6-hydroxy-3-cyclohexene-1-carboxylic-acid synthase [Pseudozobellia sp.]|nr:2-succinyl-5-enolpyruvyl-6-hydroxy-3-cyclohexene-1-carboxylic-acid synthase [Pseudozobellia sp.]MBG48513.1 2-succinyl-5-enolpyruvyl-6-hydroxy-3-cyclohexene-1-carboxylic-acid synthase [Pseudozobellia sp.]|tara:strand:+ start:2147 stop:3901 length:1755 start_codon:yes stop_codon:yes gene_type:complete